MSNMIYRKCVQYRDIWGEVPGAHSGGGWALRGGVGCRAVKFLGVEMHPQC